MPDDFLEKTIEDIIFENKGIIHEKGFEVLLGNTFRQYLLPSGKKIDILSFDHTGDEILLYLIELKKDKTTSETLIQAYGYLDELLLLIKPIFKTVYLKVIIVGKKVTDMPISKFLATPTESYSYKYGFNGIEFKMQTSNCDVAINGKKNAIRT